MMRWLPSTVTATPPVLATSPAFEGEGAVAPEEKGVDRGFEQELVAAVEVLAVEESALDELGEHLLFDLPGRRALKPST